MGAGVFSGSWMVIKLNGTQDSAPSHPKTAVRKKSISGFGSYSGIVKNGKDCEPSFN